MRCAWQRRCALWYNKATPSSASRGSGTRTIWVSLKLGGFALRIYKRGATTEEAFWWWVDKTDECWLWTGPQRNGYGSFTSGGVRRYAHRYSFERIYGTIPRRLELDHLCRKTLCVNPEHLEAVSHVENVRRGLAGKVNNPSTQKTHCPHGHPYDLINTIFTNKGERVCRTCTVAKRRRHYLSGMP